VSSDPSVTHTSAQETLLRAIVSDVKARSPEDAAVLLAEHPAATISSVLLELNPGLAQEVLAELPGGLQDGVLHAVAPEVAQQLKRNQAYPRGTSAGLWSRFTPCSSRDDGRPDRRPCGR
jgi:Mg/Co/Ni transporter MgtE